MAEPDARLPVEVVTAALGAVVVVAVAAAATVAAAADLSELV